MYVYDREKERENLKPKFSIQAVSTTNKKKALLVKLINNVEIERKQRVIPPTPKTGSA